MSEELAAVLLRQPADRVLGLSAAKNGKVLVTVQGDGVISYTAAKQAPGDSRALGSSQAQLLAPVQQVGGSYIAAVLPPGSAHGFLVCTPVTAQQPRPLLDAEQQLPLTVGLHSLHVLQHTGHSTSSSGQKAGVAAVVLANGTVGAADFSELCIRPAPSSSPAAGASASQTPVRQRSSSSTPVLVTASNGHLLAVARQAQGQPEVVVDIYTAASSSSSSSGHVDAGPPSDAAAHQQHQQQQQQPPSIQLTHSCQLAGPSSSSKLCGVTVSAGLVALLWLEGAATVYHSNLSLQPSSQQPAYVASLQLPAELGACSSTAAVAGGEQPSSRKRKAAPDPAGAAASRTWACAALSDQHLLLVWLQSGKAAGAQAVRYVLLDSRYGSCLAVGSFSTQQAAAAAAAAAGPLQLLPLPQHPTASAALLAAGAVWLLPVQLPRADLAGLVTKLALSSKAAVPAQTAATAPAAGQLLTSCQQLNLAAIAAAVNGSTEGQQQQQTGPCLLHQVPAAAAAGGGGGDAVVESAAEQFWKALSKQPYVAAELRRAAEQLCSTLQQQQKQAQQHQQQHQQQQPQQASSVLLSQKLLAQGLAALAEVGEWSALQQLHDMQSLQALTVCPGLVPALAAAQQYPLMRQVLLAAQEIPAESIVSAMQHVLQAQQAGPSQAAQTEARQMRAAAEAAVRQAEAAYAAGDAAAVEGLMPAARRAAAAVDGFVARELLLHLLLAAPTDAIEVQVALKELPSTTVLRLLRYLIKWLSKHNSQPLTSSPVDPLLITPSFSQVLEWSKLLLDAHLTRLAMLPDARVLLQQLHQLLEHEATFTSRLVALKGVTDHMAMGAPLPAAAEAANSEYTLELLDLRVRRPVGVGKK